MDFIVIILGLLLLRYFHNVKVIQVDTWFSRLVRQLSETIKQPKSSFFVSLLLPVLLVIVVDYLLVNRVFGLASFFLNLLVLVYAFGRGNLAAEIDNYKDDLQRNDIQAAFHDAATFNPGNQQSDVSDVAELRDQSVAAIGYRYLEHFFAVIFWYLLAGAAGAILYRLLQLHHENKYSEFGVTAAQRFLWMLEWLPIRLMGVTLALVGNFISCFKILLDALLDFQSLSKDVLKNLVCGALDVEPASQQDVKAMEIAAVQLLLQRALICMVCLLALWVIFV